MFELRAASDEQHRISDPVDAATGGCDQSARGANAWLESAIPDLATKRVRVSAPRAPKRWKPELRSAGYGSIRSCSILKQLCGLRRAEMERRALS